MIPLSFAHACGLPDRPAAVIRAVQPQMPPLAAQQGLFGVVGLRVAVDASGAVRDVTVQSSPWKILEPEAVAAARASTFRPARKACANVASAYAFSVLYDEDAARVPQPSQAPASSPPSKPAPDLNQPWTLVASGLGDYLVWEQTLTSGGTYRRTLATFPMDNGAVCTGHVDDAVVERIASVLRTAQPERWSDRYPYDSDPTPRPSPKAAPTRRPVTDVVALPPAYMFSVHTDGASTSIVLTQGAIAYGAAYGMTDGPAPGHVRVPPGVLAVAPALDAALPRCPARH